jgi:hypothetical protein
MDCYLNGGNLNSYFQSLGTLHLAYSTFSQLIIQMCDMWQNTNWRVEIKKKNTIDCLKKQETNPVPSSFSCAFHLLLSCHGHFGRRRHPLCPSDDAFLTFRLTMALFLSPSKPLENLLLFFKLILVLFSRFYQLCWRVLQLIIGRRKLMN